MKAWKYLHANIYDSDWYKYLGYSMQFYQSYHTPKVHRFTWFIRLIYTHDSTRDYIMMMIEMTERTKNDVILGSVLKMILFFICLFEEKKRHTPMVYKIYIRILSKWNAQKRDAKIRSWVIKKGKSVWIKISERFTNYMCEQECRWGEHKIHPP